MVRKRLGGWARIGILTSILYLLTSPIWGCGISVDQARLAEDDYHHCLMSAHDIHNNCWQDFSVAYRDGMAMHWITLGAIDLLSILFGWIAVYLVRFLVRWVARGFDEAAV